MKKLKVVHILIKKCDENSLEYWQDFFKYVDQSQIITFKRSDALIIYCVFHFPNYQQTKIKPI